MKERYLDLMEKVLTAYTPEHIESYTRDVERRGITEHGYARLTSNIGILIAHGRLDHMKESFRHMMDLCCEGIPTAREKNGGAAGNDFAVKEIVFCLLELERAGTFARDITDGWRRGLERIDPYRTYTVIADDPPKRIGNWAAFGAASEQVRLYAGIGCEKAFIERQILSQMLSLDENGMYRDPNEPMVYDLVTRLQLAVLYRFGYDGSYRDGLTDMFLRSAEFTLSMQSVSGEIPFGGRSNQFLHNEAFYAALCEFYASFFAGRGDNDRAGAFKGAAEKAARAVMPWLEYEPMSHVKNRYPRQSGYGCEDYAYFDKYMVTAGSWFYLAYLFSDDAVTPAGCPADGMARADETSEHFHKLFLACGDYFAEYEMRADPHYDASGLGRIHRREAPSAICLSVPFAAKPSYRIDTDDPSPLSICGGIYTDGGWVRGCDIGVGYRVSEKRVSEDEVSAELVCERDGTELFRETCRVSDEGVGITVSGAGDTEISFPAFDFDGYEHTDISVSGSSVRVRYKGWVCVYETDGYIRRHDTVCANRSGHYLAFSAVGCGKVTLTVRIEKEG